MVSAATQAQLQYDAAKLNYDTQAEFTTITAPIAGVIESFSPEVHDMISQTAPGVRHLRRRGDERELCRAGEDRRRPGAGGSPEGGEGGEVSTRGASPR